MSRERLLAASAIALAVGLMVGCESSESSSQIGLALGSSKPTAKTQPGMARPLTGTAQRPRGAGISLFGELTDSTKIPFAGRAARGLQRHTFTREGADFDPGLDPTGRLLIFALTRHTRRPDIYIKAVGGSAVTQLTDDPASEVQPEITADGKRVAFASDRSGNWDIWVTSIDGQNTQQVTKSPKAEIHPSWSPDGKRLVYCALNDQTRQWELWVADLGKPGTQKFIGYGLFPCWSPKDEVIAFQRARARGTRWFSIWTIQLVDGEPRYPTEVASSSDQALIAPAWTADGKKIVYCSVRTGPGAEASVQGSTSRGDVWVTDVNGLGKIRLTQGDAVNYSPACAPDGRVYFASNRSGFENIWSIVPVVSPAPMADARTTGKSPAAANP